MLSCQMCRVAVQHGFAVDAVDGGVADEFEVLRGGDAEFGGEVGHGAGCVGWGLDGGEEGWLGCFVDVSPSE